MNDIIITHDKLGAIKCLHNPAASLLKIQGLPYGTIPQRFARSKVVRHFNDTENARHVNGVFDASKPGASSIQPWGSVQSDAESIPLPTDNLKDNEGQSEDCLNLSIHLPLACLDEDNNLRKDAHVPILVFIHGGAFIVGSGNRPYYNPANLVQHAHNRGTPIIFVAINYRLGALGFWHSNRVADLLPENNGLYDQEIAFEWLRDNMTGFGGDISNVTIIGQSAGGQSISVQSMRRPLFKRAILLSGTAVTMPPMTPEEHHQTFVAHADKLGIRTKGQDGKERDAREIAKEVINIDVAKIRDLRWVGSPCTKSELFPVERPSMKLIKQGKLAPPDWRDWAQPVEAQVIGTTTYDGGVFFHMISKDKSRKDHAKSFKCISSNVLGAVNGEELCEIYGITSNSEDPDALQRICLFESDIDYFAAALCDAESGLVENTYFQIFDLPDPFPGSLPEPGVFATHAFDIVTILGGIHEDRLPKEYMPVISRWRDIILDFTANGTPPCLPYHGNSQSSADRSALLIDQHGVRNIGCHEYMENDNRRRARLFELAYKVAGDDGLDILSVDICQRFLMRGE